MSDATQPRPAKPARCTAATRRARVEELQEEIALGLEPYAAARACCTKWGIAGRRSAARYVDLVVASWARDRRLKRGASLDAALAVRRRLFRLAVSESDYSAAARVQDGIERLLGVGERSDGDRDRALGRVVSDLLDVVRSGGTDPGVLLRITGRLEAVLSGEPMPIAPLDLNLTGLTDDARQQLRNVATSLIEQRADGSAIPNGSTDPN